MGKINVVLANGTTVSVDEDTYKAAQGQPGAATAENTGQAIDRERQAAVAAKHDNVADMIATGLGTAVDTATGGLLGKGINAIDPAAGAQMRESQAQHPYVTGATEFAGVALPGLGTAGTLAKEGVTAATGSKLAGFAAEGGAIGVGAHVAHSNVTGDSLSIEGIAESFAVGGAINMGIGVLASSLRGAAKGRPKLGPEGEMTFAPVKASGAETLAHKAERLRKIADDATLAEKAYDFTANEAAAVASDKEASKLAADGVKKAKAVRSEAVAQIRENTKALNELPSYGAVKDAHSTAAGVAAKANSALEAEQKAYDAFASPKGANSAIKDYEALQNRLRAEINKAPEAPGGADPGVFPAGSKLPARARNRGYTPTAPAEALPPIADTGPGGSEFSPASRDKANPGPGGSEFSPAVRTQNEGTAVLKQMSEAKAAAQKLAKAGDWEGVATTLKNTEAEIKKWLPDETIAFPQKPTGEPMPVPLKLPTKLSDIGKMHEASMGKLANSMDDATVAELDKLAKDVGIQPGDTPGDTLTTLHKHIRATLYTPARKIGTEAAGALADAAEHDYEEYAVGGGERNFSYTSPEAWDAAAAETDAARVNERTGMLGKKEGDPGYQEPAYQESKWDYRKPSAKGVDTSSLLDTPIKLAKTGTILAVARAASRMFGFGWGGSLARVFAAEGAKVSLDSIEAAVGGAAIAGKASARSSIGEAFSRFAAAGAGALETLGPVAASLGGSFPYGKEDPATDVRDLAKNRIHDISQMTQVAPDILYNMVKNIAGEGGQVGLKLHQQYLNQLGYLNEVAPKDPGLDQTMNGSNWRPSYTQADDFAHQWQAVMHPLAYLARVVSGNGSAKGVAALAATWPAMLNEARSEATMRSWEGLTLQGHRGLSMLFQRPMSPLQDPNVFWLIQGQQLPQPQQTASTGGTRPPTGGPPGRRPAFDSAVAGSSVDALTRQG